MVWCLVFLKVIKSPSAIQGVNLAFFFLVFVFLLYGVAGLGDPAKQVPLGSTASLPDIGVCRAIGSEVQICGLMRFRPRPEAQVRCCVGLLVHHYVLHPDFE